MESPFELAEGLTRLKAMVAERPADSPFWNEAENRSRLSAIPRNADAKFLTAPLGAISSRTR